MSKLKGRFPTLAEQVLDTIRSHSRCKNHTLDIGLDADDCEALIRHVEGESEIATLKQVNADLKAERDLAQKSRDEALQASAQDQAELARVLTALQDEKANHKATCERLYRSETVVKQQSRRAYRMIESHNALQVRNTELIIENGDLKKLLDAAAISYVSEKTAPVATVEKAPRTLAEQWDAMANSRSR